MPGSTPATWAERFDAAIRSAPPSATRHRLELRPARQHRRTGAAYRTPADQPAPHSSAGPIGGGSRLPRRSRSSTRAPNPGPPGGPSRTSPWCAGHAYSPAGRPLPPGCRRRTPVWTPSPPISSSRGPRQRLAGRRTWPTSRPSGRPDIPSSMGPPSRWVWTRSGQRRPSGGHLHSPASDHAPGQPATADHATYTSWP